MKATPKTDEIITLLKRAKGIIDEIECVLDLIGGTSYIGDVVEKLDYECFDCLDDISLSKITIDDIYREYWDICSNIEDWNKYGKALSMRLDIDVFPSWLFDKEENFDSHIGNKLKRLEKQGIQTGLLLYNADLLVGILRVWNVDFMVLIHKMDEKALAIDLSLLEKGNLNYNKNDETIATIQFERLVNKGFFTSETSLDDWLYIYGVKGKEQNKNTLDWQGKQIELAYMIDTIWGDTGTNVWLICEKVFTIKGKIPNTNTMKSDLSKIKNGYKNKPKSFDKLDELLRE